MDGDLIIEDLTVTFRTVGGSVTAVDHLSQVFSEGKIYGLIGESGSGKSVLGASLLRLVPEAKLEGGCIYRGENLLTVSKKRMRQLRGREIALIPQSPGEALDPVMRIGRQISEAVVEHRLVTKKNAASYTANLLWQLGLPKIRQIPNRYSFQMSGGMNQRVVSALGISCAPKWLIADEPTKGLDSVLRQQVYGIFKELKEQNNVSMLVITHDLRLAERLCDEICVFYKGQILERQKASRIFSSPLHPYTKALVDALPGNGMIPAPEPVRKSGNPCCAYFERCPSAKKRCGELRPNRMICGSGEVKCFLYAEN